MSNSTVEPRFNEVAGDRPNLFVKWRVRYIENLDITNLRGNDQNVRYIEVIVNDWFVIQVTSVTQFNVIFVTQKCRVLRCNSLSMVGFQYQLFSLLSRRAAFVYKRTTLSEYGTSQIVGHVPLTLSRVFHLFLKHGGQISVEVETRALARGGGGYFLIWAI